MKGLRMLWMLGWVLAAGDGFGQSSSPRGLKGEYFNGPNFEQKVYTRTDPMISFNWNGMYPAPGVAREYFSVRWTGKLYAPKSGKYRFSAMVDDGIRIWVGGKKVMDEWRKQDDTKFIGEVTLQAGRFYDLKVEYYNDWKGSTIFVFWEVPETNRNPLSFSSPPREEIPAKYLFSPPTPPARKTATGDPMAVVKPKPKPVEKPAEKLVTQRGTEAVRPKLPPENRKPIKTGVEPLAKPAPPAAEPVAAVKPPEAPAPGAVFTLKSVRFAQSDYTLLPESCSELDRLVATLRAFPAVRIQIAGHTDNIGDPRLNLALSENRARVVASYLIRHGIPESRISARGYGGTRPVADNAVLEERARNRRVEFIVE
ncbi:PA14 domain-containing protein [Larkinella soli]|uniref:PA14 domain-containing protein n=1 Tax=Larkinella soli TaxID=1770527 RepID=UPI000FFB32FC|nr:PA14 domain-containing protein [Larkinella soli]